jgi:hypothetical protein
MSRRFSLSRRSSFLQAATVDESLKPQTGVANQKSVRVWHFHKGKQFAGLTRFQQWFNWKRNGRFLRDGVARPPPKYIVSPQWTASEVELAHPSPKLAEEIETFLVAHYRTKSGLYYHKGSVDWMRLLLHDKNVVILLRNPERELCGLVTSLDHKGQFGFRSQTTSKNPRLVEFFCIHPMLRKRGIGGWLLAWLDHHVSRLHDTSWHFSWFFGAPKLLPTSMPRLTRVHYVRRIFARQSLRKYESEKAVRVDSSAALQIMSEIASNDRLDWPIDLGLSFDMLFMATQDIQWWRIDVDVGFGCSILVGLQPTRWRMQEGQVWQVVYCSYVRSRPGNVHDITMPFWEDAEHYKDIPQKGIETACVAAGCPVVLVSNIPGQFGGGQYPQNWRGWSAIKEVSDLYIYNWMPPSSTFDYFMWVGSTI